jgi:hypothetical protein
MVENESYYYSTYIKIRTRKFALHLQVSLVVMNLAEALNIIQVKLGIGGLFVFLVRVAHRNNIVVKIMVIYVLN